MREVSGVTPKFLAAVMQGTEMPLTELEKTGVGLDQGLEVGCVKVEMPVRHKREMNE